jgi:hypothetical protein
MPELEIQIMDAESPARSVAPLLQFRARITNSPATETIQAVVLNAQIQIQPAQRKYSPEEQENLFELFGAPESWGQTLRNRLWAQTSATVGSFLGSTEILLTVPCTFDLNVASAKYFKALEGGDIPLLFLFSGTVFYATDGGRLQIAPISWNTESVWRMPVKTWRALMDQHLPNSMCLPLRRDVFEKLSAYRREQRLVSWEETLAQLLDRSTVTPAIGKDVLA